MALIACKECKTEISSSASACPHCGIKWPALTAKSTLQGTIILLGLIIVPIFLYLSNKPQVRAPQYIPKAPILSPNQRISNHAIDIMTPEQYPETYKIWGAEKVEWLNSIQKSVALYALKNYDCKFVDSLALSPSKSSAPDHPVFYVDCKESANDKNYAGYKKYYVDVNDLK